MLNLTPFLKLYARYRQGQLTSQNHAATQEAQLFHLIKKGAQTAFGKDHRFSGINSVAEYQACVPLRTHAQFWEEYWSKSFPVLKDCTWPGTVPYFNVTSGTTSGVTKYIPYTPEMVRSTSKAGLDLLVHHVTQRPNSKLLAGKSFILGGSTDLTKEAPGIVSGDMSGISIETMPLWARMRSFPPKDMALISDWEEKIRVMGTQALKENIRSVGGVPSWLLIFFDKMFDMHPQADGQVSKLFPDLEMLIHGGVNFGPYRKRFEELLQDTNAEMREVYPASEGWIATADRGYGDGLRLNLDHGIFYEFVPLEELGSERPTRHWIGNVEPGVNYAIVLTTCAGMWSYVIGDTVSFREPSEPRVLITGRTAYMLSAFGEHLIDAEIEASITRAATDIGNSVSDYSVGPVYPSKKDELGGHRYFVEFLNEISNENTVKEFELALDKYLCEENEDYEAHRSDGFGLNLPEVRVAPPGMFTAWMKDRGKLGGQHKVPRIITSEDLFQHLCDFHARSMREGE